MIRTDFRLQQVRGQEVLAVEPQAEEEHGVVVNNDGAMLPDLVKICFQKLVVNRESDGQTG
jgi:hypothetical protein